MTAMVVFGEGQVSGETDVAGGGANILHSLVHTCVYRLALRRDGLIETSLCARYPLECISSSSSSRIIDCRCHQKQRATSLLPRNC